MMVLRACTQSARQHIDPIKGTTKGEYVSNQENGELFPVAVKNAPTGRVKLFETTTAGRELLKKHGITTTWRRGGAVHGYWVRQIASELAKKGWARCGEAPDPR